MGVPHRKFEPQALGNEELEVKDIRRCCPGYVLRIHLKGYGVIGSLCGQEQRSQPGALPNIRLMKVLSIHVAHMTFLGCQSITVFLR